MLTQQMERHGLIISLKVEHIDLDSTAVAKRKELISFLIPSKHVHVTNYRQEPQKDN